MIELWRDVVGFEEYFKISSFGNLYSKRTNKILKQSINKNGYCQVSTRIGGRLGKSYCFKVHRIVAEAFFGEPSKELLEESKNTFYGKVCVNHKDGVKTNNRIENLEWISSQGNAKHAYDLGLSVPKKGLENPTSKLSQEDVLFIREKYTPYCSKFGARALANTFGVSHSTISMVTQGKTYNQCKG